MSKKAKSFEEFYSKNKDDILDIDIVADYAESHDGDTTPFDKDMFCPECKQAELSFVHKTSKRRAHLRRIKSSNHKDGCSYKYYLLQIYTQNKKGEWKFRTSLYRGNMRDLVNEEVMYNIVMIGHLDFQFKPFTIKLANKNAIKYREA